MRALTEQEQYAINSYIEVAWARAEREARDVFGKFKALNQQGYIRKRYHQFMNEHAANLGLRVI